MFETIVFAVFFLLLVVFGFLLGIQYENRRIRRRLKELTEEKVPCCGNCSQYDGDRCMKEWNNLDECYYLPDRDDKEPEDVCEDCEERIE